MVLAQDRAVVAALIEVATDATWDNKNMTIHDFSVKDDILRPTSADGIRTALVSHSYVDNN